MWRSPNPHHIPHPAKKLAQVVASPDNSSGCETMETVVAGSPGSATSVLKPRISSFGETSSTASSNIYFPRLTMPRRFDG